MKDQVQNTPTRILRLKEVCSRVGLCRASIYRMVRGGEFPRSVLLGARSVGWRESDVEAWLSSRQPNAPVGL